MVVKRAAAGASLATPQKPDFDGTTVVVKTTPNVKYTNKDTSVVLTTAAPVTLAEGASITVQAEPASGSYFFASNQDDEWTFKNVS
jgi:hypothetical protein